MRSLASTFVREPVSQRLVTSTLRSAATEDGASPTRFRGHWRDSRALNFPAMLLTPRNPPGSHAASGYRAAINSEIIFKITEADEGGYCASALGFGIHTQGETLEELRAMVRDAVSCYFDAPEQTPNIIRLHFVRDEVLAR